MKIKRILTLALALCLVAALAAGCSSGGSEGGTMTTKEVFNTYEPVWQAEIDAENEIIAARK